jgi:hypothetical protein
MTGKANNQPFLFILFFSKYSFSLKTSENPKKTTPENAL